MNATTGLVPVIAAPMLDPGRNRISAELPYGLTIAEIVDRVLTFPVSRRHIRVALVTPHGSQIVPHEVWDRARPHAGVQVVIRVVPGKDALKSILQIVVAIAAVAIGAYFAPALSGALGISQGLAQGIISLGVTVLGNLLINALIPPPKPDDDQSNRYSINGWKNRLDPDGAVPFVMGKLQYAPPFAALSHSEIVGDFLYIRALFNFGYGQLSLSNFRIGETSLSEYDEVDIEVRDGLTNDAPVSFYPQQIAEESVGAELILPLPRNDLGEVISGPPEPEPITRTSGADASGASVILAWPAGLFKTNDEGKLRAHAVTVQIQQRLVQAEEWQEVITLNVRAKQREGFYRQHTWQFPSRGRWQIRCIMQTAETEDMKKQQKTSWAALQTLRPEYPLNFDSPLALVALRVKATHQLNGQLDNFNALAERVCLDYDYTSGEWVSRTTSNPASKFRLALQSSANPRPVLDDGIDLDLLAEWHDFCRINDLKYDRALDDPSMSIGDVLSEIAAAGRATKRHDGRKWGVVIDRPQDLLVVDHFSPRNSSNFKVSRSYYQKPDGFRVKFLDATNDYKPAERLVPWPGHDGEIKLTEALELPGKTDPDEIYVETRRRMYEAIHRPDVYRLSKDGPIGVATRGDRVMVSQDTIERTQTAARVRSVEDRLISLDDMVTMNAGEEYAIRFRVFEDDDDTIGTSIVRNVINHPGETSVIIVNGDGEMPMAGELLHFGIAGKESFSLVVSGIEAGQDMSCHYKMIDASPVIDELLAAETVPAWSGRVGAEIDENLLQPPAPRFISITTSYPGTGTAVVVEFLIAAGSGPISSAGFVIEHRLTGASAWQELAVSAADGGGTLNYSNGQQIQLQAYAKSASGQIGPRTAPVTFTVGEDDMTMPTALDATKITVASLLGGAVVQFQTTDDLNTTRVQIYRSRSAALNRETDAVKGPIAVEQSRSYSVPVGDTTRENLLLNGAFDSSASWALGNGWTIASGKATKAAGSASSLTQALTTSAGKYYRISFTLSTVTAGSVTPQLTGGTTRSGTARNANGAFIDRLQAVTGNATFAVAATSAFAGSIDDVAVYLETSTCLEQGTHNIWLEPQNGDGVPGAIAGPFTVQVK